MHIVPWVSPFGMECFFAYLIYIENNAPYLQGPDCLNHQNRTADGQKVNDLANFSSPRSPEFLYLESTTLIGSYRDNSALHSY